MRFFDLYRELYPDSITKIFQAGIENLPKLERMIGEPLSPGYSTRAMAYELARSILYGENSFFLSEAVIMAFENTTIPKTQLKFFRLPYPSFWVDITQRKETFIFKGKNQYTELPIHGFMLAEIPEGIRIIVWGKNQDTPPDGLSCSGVLGFHGATSEESFVDFSEYNVDSYDGNEVDKDWEQIFRAICRIAVNLLLYMNSEKPIVEVIDYEKKRREASVGLSGKKLEKKLERLRHGTVTRIAPNLKLRIVREATGNGGSNPSGIPMRLQIVRGHWRNVACKDRHYMRWIEPYWRGEDLGGVVSRTYKI